MKQAILIMAHKNMKQVKKLVDFFEGQCDVYIHIDKNFKVRDDELKDLENSSGVRGVYRKYRVHWGGFSVLEAEIYLMKCALRDGNAGYFHVLSGEDYPIKPLYNFLHFFSHTSVKGFLSCNHLPSPYTDYNTYHRLQYYIFSDFISCRDDAGQKRLWRIVDWEKKMGIKRRIPDFFPHLYGGSAWFSFSREVTQFVVDYTKKRPAFYNRMRFTYVPEEIYVPTVALNSPYCQQIEWKNNCRTIVWDKNENDKSPKNIKKKDFGELLTNPMGFFARKFDFAQSLDVVGLVDRYLLSSHKHDIEVSETGVWNTEYIDKFVFDNGLKNCLLDFCRKMNIHTVCDFGCGPGWYVAYLHSKGVAAVGYDGNLHTAELSSLMSGGLALCDCVELTEDLVADEKFDLVLCIDVCQYIKEEYWKIFIGNLIRNTGRYLVMTFTEDYMRKMDVGEQHLLLNGIKKGGFVINEYATYMFRLSITFEKYKESIVVLQRI